MGKSVIKEYVYNTTPGKIWKALTDKEEMKIWYFDLEAFQAEVGFEFRFGEELKNEYICTFAG
jgi:uncharacterized protein YndB with AHSA1/START domain